MKGLPDQFYKIPLTASVIMDSKDLKELLLTTGGRIIALGDLWDIQTKHLAVGVYRVTLRQKKYE